MTVFEPGFPIPEDIGMLNDQMLNYWGQRFVMEIKRQDGKDYPPTTLHQLVCGLQRYLRNDCGKEYVNFIKEGTQFNDFRKSLDTRMKELYGLGVGNKLDSSDPVTMNDEIQLWKSGVFDENSAEGLSNAIFYYNGKLFGFRGFTEHVNCQASQFEILEDKERKLRYIKLHLVNVRIRRVESKAEKTPKHQRVTMNNQTRSIILLIYMNDIYHSFHEPALCTESHLRIWTKIIILNLVQVQYHTTT